MLDYYTLQRTLEMLKESPNDEYTAQDLAILCRQGILTPVFAYNRYCMEIMEYYYDVGKPEPSIGRSPEPMTTHFYDGYLTDKRLLSLLDKSVDKLELFDAMTYKSDGSGWEIALVANALNVRKYLNSEEYSVYSDNDHYTVTRESLLFPSEQVQSYIASRQTNEQQRIAELEKLLEQAYADNEKPKQQTNMPADDNIEQDHLYNWQAMNKNQYPPELHLAIEIWKEYYQVDAIKDISQFNAGRFNKIANDFNLSQGNLKSRIRSLLTPLNSKTKSPELLSSLEAINIIHNDKLEQD